jgi:hypothetical protein
MSLTVLMAGGRGNGAGGARVTSSGPAGTADELDPGHRPAPLPRGVTSRRSFLAGACTAVLGLAVSGCVGPEVSNATPAQDRSSRPTPLALPGGTLIRGANITVKDSNYPRPWHNLWLEWDWERWIKWQVDLAKSVGANCIRMIGSVSVVAEGALPFDQYGARWSQLLEYLSAQGMLAYPCPGQLDQWGSGTPSQAEQLYRQLGEVFSGHSNVLAVDVSNEALNEVAGGRSAAELEGVLMPLDHALRQTMDKPLAHSMTVSRAEDWAWPWISRFSEMSDVLDVHVYYRAAPSDAAALLHNTGGTRPVLVGEFGIGTDRPEADRVAYFQSIKKLLTSDRRFVGALAWDIASSRFGLFDSDGVARHDIADVFTTFPLRR